MDIEKTIEQLNEYSAEHQQHGGITAQAADALSTLQIENQALRNAANEFKAENEKLRAEVEQVKRERNAAKSQEALEAIDELMEFARTRMSTADWLYYVDALGEWRGQKED